MFDSLLTELAGLVVHRVAVKGVEAEKVRLHRLDTYGIGVIATGPTDIGIAFSCLEVGGVEPLFEDLHKATQDMC